jgi:hypothetical protein
VSKSFHLASYLKLDKPILGFLMAILSLTS